MAPLLPIYSVLFLDIKIFLAPSLINAAKMQEDVGGSRRKFHLNLAVTLAAIVVISIAFALFLSYMRGAQQMPTWFYSSCPQVVMTAAYNATTTPAHFQTTTALWYLVGALWTALSMYLRRTLFWFPHPIGYVMLVNPLMSRLWFSFFIGWVAKKIVVKYGGKSTFDKVRLIFIGLILGELFAIFFWNVLALLFNFEIHGIDLNRYGA